IRTPMNGIIGMSELMLGTAITGEARQYAQIVHSSANNLLDIINDILDFSKIEAGKLTLETIDFEPRLVVENVAEILVARAREKSVSLMTFVAPEVAAVMRGDPVRLRQVLLNLAGNALKFTEHGEVVVRVMVDEQSAARARLRFEVSDTGIGLSDSACRKLFQPFTQADGSTSRKYGGTGLGLSISKRLVEMMRGEIGVGSVEGQGSTFWFTCDFEVSSARSVPSRVAPEAMEGKRVLIVDDSKTNRDIVEAYLTSWRIQHASAADAPTAHAMLKEAVAKGEPFDVVVTDLRLPEMDGFALARTVQRDPALRGTRLVLLTAFDAIGQGKQALEAGFSAYLTKPVKRSHLFDALANAVFGPALSAATAEGAAEQIESVAATAPATATGTAGSASSATDGATRPPAQDGAARDPGKLVLLAEDNAVNQLLASKQLQKLGYTVHTVATGQEALEALARTAYAVVLMDCHMPVMDGYEATRAIRQAELGSGKHVPIIAMTANAIQGDREACLAAGMDDYVSKPVKLDDLSAVIRRWLPATAGVDTAASVLRSATPERPAAFAPTDTLASVRALDRSVLTTMHGLDISDEPELVGQVVVTFLGDAGDLLERLREASERGDIVALFRAAHSLKASSSLVGAMRLSSVAKQIEMACSRGALADVPEYLTHLRAEYERVRPELEAAL
ncbi:MAG TPA: response regulator, partial [Ktedonobacterales bacterium]|nr:response regulator [Ktedonobacterales bacterium]